MEKNRIKILSTEVDKVNRKEALEIVRLFLSSQKGSRIITLNPEMIVEAKKDEKIAEIINGADLILPDGTGILIAADFIENQKGTFLSDIRDLFLLAVRAVISPDKIRKVLPERISGVDFMLDVCESEFVKGKKFFFLGAGKGIAARTAGILKDRFPNIEIAGAEEGIRKDSQKEDNEKLIKRINAASPDVLFVAFGFPKQEKWIAENLERLPRSVRVAMGVGGSFDFISGKIRRAPKMLRDHGLEWLWRLAMEPKRIKRIYNATFKLSWLIFRDKKAKIR